MKKCIRRSPCRRKRRRKKNTPRILRASYFQDLMKPAQLKSLRHLELFPGGRQFGIGKNNCLFLCQMKDKPFPAQFRISAEQPQPVIERDRKPAAIFVRVEIDIGVDTDRKQKQQRSQKERIYKKFAHNRNMGEFPKTMKF